MSRAKKVGVRHGARRLTEMGEADGAGPCSHMPKNTAGYFSGNLQNVGGG